MNTLIAFVLTYIIGGLTFVPLILVLVLLHAHLTFPDRERDLDSTAEAPRVSTDALRHSSDDEKSLLSGQDALSKSFVGEHEKDVAEGYFAVCREYVPGGVNGKPPVRATPAGEVVAGESPSVYQSMYRSLFDRRQNAAIIDPAKGDTGKTAKRARNVFYVVLRHGHLMMYDDAEQVEVRHVISLAYHDVSIYAGGGAIPEGELWIKRNAIRLSRKVASGDTSSASLPFYFFSENCSDKEDFYFALLQNQERDGRDIVQPPQVENFEARHIISLVQKLHSSEEQLQTRWLNAIVGRLFLAVYKTQEVEDFIRAKITKKIARVKKPGFLPGIQLRKISLGESAPLVTNPKLKDLTIDGSCCVEADVKYEGMFRLELAATVRIDLSTRFKAREVNVILAVVVKKLEGHVLVRVKPAPSNRLWIAFEKMPKLELSIEPIVSSRQITYGIILRTIESRIREVIAETLVLPNWDDTPFLSTAGHRFRGGIWTSEKDDSEKYMGTTVPHDDSGNESETAATLADSPTILPVANDKSISMPSLVDDALPAATSRKSHKASRSEITNMATASGAQRRPSSPTVVRSKSFAATAGPVLNKDMATSDVKRSEAVKHSNPKDAQTLMTELSNRSQPSTPLDSPVGSFSPRRLSVAGQKEPPTHSLTSSSRSSVNDELSNSQATITESSQSLSPSTTFTQDSRSISTGSTNGSHPPSRVQTMAGKIAPSEKKQQAFYHAAAAAKNWGWNRLNRKGQSENPTKTLEPAGTPEQPIGRGRPLPPPGVPLPPPAKRDSISSLALPKRRPVPPPPLPNRKSSSGQAKPDLPPRARPNSTAEGAHTDVDRSVMVVAAPEEEDLAPSETEDAEGYGDFMENVVMSDNEAAGMPEEAADEVPAETAGESIPQAVTRNPAESSASSRSHSDDEALASWHAAEEEEARSKSVWIDQQVH